MTTGAAPGDQRVNLENCDREPIQIPGHIQPHGALLAFDAAGVLIAHSANTLSLLGLAVAPGKHMDDLHFVADDADLHELMSAGLQELALGDVLPTSLETTLNGREFDFVVHGYAGRLVVEFESREQSAGEVAAFAMKAHRAIDRLKRQKSIDDLLRAAVEQLRMLTGFDRVMAYRFRHDDSGDVVAEACSAGLDPYLGRRYPAGDIPAQARRLYTLNTLRAIPDVGYRPVPMLGRDGDAPLDMSHSILRSVSPIHIEYLQNMGVGASMSVSIVVGGKLWGMLACHHMARRLVPHSIRMACDVMAQVLAATVQSLLAQEETDLATRAASVRTQLMETLLHSDDVLHALLQHGEDLKDSLQADALILAELGKLVCVGPVDAETAALIIQSLPDVAEADLVARSERSEWPPGQAPSIGKWVGALGIQFDSLTSGWIVALRVEQVETVRWGGRPEKDITSGPLGPRLTPRGSFEEWREIVRDTAEPWRPISLEIARRLLGELRRASHARYADLERARTQLLAMLGHDLRDPLNSISMAASAMNRSDLQPKLGQRIQNASGRMQRLISYVLDMSRLRSGLGLGIERSRVDLAELLGELIDEQRFGHPGKTYAVESPAALHAEVDRDRVTQVIANLLSNARHHGEIGQSIRLKLDREGEMAVVTVRNVAPPIDEALAASLFDPFKRQSLHNARNPTGMGLGLYIAKEIVGAHAGTLQYEYQAPHVVFTVRLPIAKDEPGA